MIDFFTAPSIPVHERVKQVRQQLNISQDELAKRLGYKSRSTISKIEAGENDIPLIKLKPFADALGVSMEFLLGLTEYDANGKEVEARNPVLVDAPTFSANERLYLDEYKLVHKFRYLDEKDKELIHSLIDCRLKQMGYEPDEVWEE